MIRTLLTLLVWWIARTAFRLGERLDAGRATSPALIDLPGAPLRREAQANAPCTCALCGRRGTAAGEIDATCSRCQHTHEGHVCERCARDGYLAWAIVHRGCVLGWRVGARA